MRKHLVYDLPTRFFHWLFAGLFLTAFIIGKTVDDKLELFNYHSLAGLTLGFLVILRLLWGFFGSRHSRFGDFSLKPSELIEYFKGILKGEKARWAGHNPASSWSALIMLTLGLSLGLTGYLMTSGYDKESFEDIHEILANAFLLVVLAHIAGLVTHSLRHKDRIGLSMIDGKKAQVPPEECIHSSRPALALLFLGLVVSFGFYLIKNYDTETKTLQFLGSTLQLND